MMSSPHVSSGSSELAAAIDAIVRAALVRQQLPGLSIAVAREGQLLFARGYGRRNLGEELPADAETIYSIASISKQFTAAAIMLLAEGGRLRVEDSVKRYFPWLSCGDEVELRHLLSHTSGLRDYFPLEDLDRIGFASVSPREIAERAGAGGPAFAPGGDYQYCNTGYVLLGAIVERVAEMTYADYLARGFFEPLEMTRTGVDDTPVVRSDVAIGYTSFALGPWELARDYHPSWEFGTGGLYSTVSDMLRWNCALRGGRIVSPESFARMTTASVLTDGRPVNYGFGLAVNAPGGVREVRHTGGLPGMSTDNATYPDLDVDIVVFVNADARLTYGTITRPILALLCNAPELAVPVAPARLTAADATEPVAAGQWLRGVLGGSLAGLALTPKFERSLRPELREQLTQLPDLVGTVRAIRLLDANRRDPETTFAYDVECERRRLAVSLTVHDNGNIAGLSLMPWDERG